MTAAEERLQQDADAQILIASIQELQKKLEGLQQSGLEASEEQVKEFQDKHREMSANPSINAFMTAQQELGGLIQEVNQAISEGMAGEEE